MRKVSCFHKRWAIAAALGCTVAAVAVDELTAGNPAGSSAAAQIHVTLASAAGEPLLGEGFVVFKGSASETPVVVPVKLPAPVAAELPAGSQWTLIADFPGFFAATSVLQVPREALAGPLEVQVTLRPAGMLKGKFVVDGKERLPERLEARFEPTREALPKKADIPAGSAPCAVGPSGEWQCRLPAGQLDVALHPKGFVPHYVWNIEIGAGETSSLGSRKLTRGASVAGWVTREDGTPAEKCRVRLEPTTAPGRPNDAILELLRAVATEVSCQKKGFFQFSALGAGSYVLVAQENDARAQMSPVEVWDGAESRLTVPIVLRRPVDFEVTLSPPIDWLGRPWRVEALRASEYRSGWEEPSYRAEATQEGSVRLPKQRPGRFWITVRDRLGNAVFSDPHVDLSDPTQPYPITLDLLWVEGRIHLGDEPVAGRLFFGGRNGATLIKMTSNASGRFEGPLPKPGDWRVDIEGAEPRLTASVMVEIKPKGDRASVSIELPDTVVYGRVVDPSGMLAPGAEVTLSSTAGTTVIEADKKGEFEIRAFPEGTNELSAAQSAGHGEREVSDTYEFEAAEDLPHGPVVLTLRRNRAIRGRVLAPTGPVIGATVSSWPTLGGDGVVSTARSRLDGSFELKVPAGTQAVQMIVSPPAGALKAYEMNVSSDAELLFQVEPLGGELVVALEKSEPAVREILAIWQEDIGIPLGTLVRWAEGHGVRFRQGNRVHIPQLAPGSYTVCLGAPALVASSELDAWKKSRARCATGYLAAASVLDLRLP
ncbi:MAG TPA: carboxypeptidase-like regulatory domain-containing protein [Thermoanaerobaculia bacterium]|nr:carboxypeptidase-like regulatory domain-containing protein [Thermoanaerobaculia bacterium]